MIGFTAQFVAREEGIFILWKLLPHGVFEIPAVVIAMGLGLYLGSRLLEERFLIKDMTKRLVIIFLVCVLLVPFFGFYVAASDSIGLDTAQDFSSFSGTDLTVLFGIALINLLFIACFVFVLMTFLRYKPLRRDLVNCLWAFILIVIPLLIIAGIVEGLLITLLG